MALKLSNNIKLRTIDLPRKDFRDFDVDNTTVLNSTSNVNTGGTTGPLIDGEFVVLTAGGKLVRALDAVIAQKPYLVIAGAGRTDTLVTKKATVYFGSDGFEFDTKLFGASADTGGGDDTGMTPGTALTVGSVSWDGATYKSALRLAAPGEPVRAVVVANKALTGTDYIRVQLV